MFLETSRYAQEKIRQIKTRNGALVSAMSLRILPETAGDEVAVAGNDRLDVMAQRHYRDPTRFWHIVDANTELEARTLLKPPGVETPNPPEVVIKVPAK